jgi:tight adherence protein B
VTPFVLILVLIALTIVLAGGVAIVGLAAVIQGTSSVNERLETYAAIPDNAPTGTGERSKARLIRYRLRLNNMLSMFTSDKLSLQLSSANWPISETEFILIRIWGIIAGFILGWLLFRTPISGFGFAVIAYLLPGLLLQRAIHKRRSDFQRQLIDVLVLVNGAVGAGYSLLQALDVVVQEMRAPASEEFRRVRREIGLGLPMGQALENLHQRMQSDDLYLVITAININSQVGGSLTTMLSAVTQTIRERVRLFGEVRAITSQQRYSSYILTMLPFLIAGALFVLSPDYIKKLFEPGIFLCFPIGAIIFIMLGNLAVMRLTKIDV